MKKGFYAEYGFRIIFVVVFLLAFIWMGTRRTIQSNSNAVEDWLPPQYQETKDYNWYLKQFPFESFIVVSWNGCTLSDDRVELFAQKLVPGQTIDNFSLSSPGSEIKADLNLSQVPDRLAAAPPSSSPASPSSGVLALSSPVAGPPADKAVSGDSSPKEEDLYFRSVMTGPRLVRLLEQTYAKTPQNRSEEELQEEILQRLNGTLIGPPDAEGNRSTALIITLNTGFKGGGKKMQKLIDRVKELSVECGLPDTTVVKTGSLAARAVGAIVDVVREIVYGRHPRTDALILGGPPTDNAALDQEGTRTLYRLAGICALISLGIAIICLRNFRLTMFVFWVAIISAGFAMASVSLTGGHCDSILLSMPALVYVLAMSGSIHLVNYYHDAIREGGLEGATERAVRHAFSPCFFAQLTTAIGLGSLFAGQLAPITNFGFYSALGVMMSLILLFLYLPALLFFFPSKDFARKHGGKGLNDNEGFIVKFWSLFGRFIVRYHNWVAGVCFAMMIFFAVPIVATMYLNSRPEEDRPALEQKFRESRIPLVKTSVKMMNFFSPDAEIIAHYAWLEEKLGPLVPMELVVSFDNARLPQSTYGTSERLRLINYIGQRLKEDLAEDVGGTLSVAMFAPDLDAVWDPGSITHRIAGRAVGKTIDDRREDLKDYLTIEGNPTTEEIRATLAEFLDEAKNEYLARRKALAEKATASGTDLAALGPDVTVESEGAESSPEGTDPPNAEIAELWRQGKTFLRLKEMGDAMDAARPEWKDGGLADLSDITGRLEAGKPFRSLSAEQASSLLAACRLWQEKKGIELWRISIRVWSLKKDIDYSAFIKDVKAVVEPILAETSEDLMAEIGENASSEAPTESAPTESAAAEKVVAGVTTGDEGATVGELGGGNPVAERSTGSPHEGDRLAQVKKEFGEGHADDIIYPAGLSAKYTGMVPLVYKTQHALIHGLTNSIVMAFFLIAIVIMIILRNMAGGLVAMIPNLFPVICVFGFMAWAGILIDVGTMMTASVALGVAVDDTMHYLTWFSDGINRGNTPKEAAVWGYKRCATAMTQSTLIAGLGLLAFAFSTFVPTQRFGVLMLAILFVALIGDLVMLPALLTGPAGYFFRTRRKQKDEEQTPAA